MSDFTHIEIKKIIRRRGSSELGTEIDNIPIETIKNFRPWYHDDEEKKYIKGDITLVKVASVTHKEGYEEVKINESSKSFGTRLGRVIPLDEGTGK